MARLKVEAEAQGPGGLVYENTKQVTLSPTGGGQEYYCSLAFTRAIACMLRHSQYARMCMHSHAYITYTKTKHKKENVTFKKFKGDLGDGLELSSIP